MTDRAYTVAEIDRMRNMLRSMLSPHPRFNSSMSGGFTYQLPKNYERDWDNRVEQQLRTYMLAGTTPDELAGQYAEWDAAFTRKYEAAS